NEDLPLGSRGGMAIRHYFPADGEYVMKITLQAPRMGGQIRGLQEPHLLDVRLDGTRIQRLTIGAKLAQGAVYSMNDLPDPEIVPSIRFTAKAGPGLVGISFLPQNFVLEGALQPFNVRPESLPRLAHRDIELYTGGDPAIDTVAIDGPFNPEGMG